MTITQEQRQYLNALRRSGKTNMFGAGAYLERRFGINRKEAVIILGEWMETFSEADK